MAFCAKPIGRSHQEDCREPLDKSGSRHDFCCSCLFLLLFNNRRMLTEYYRAAREAAAIAQKDLFGILKFTGSERVSWLQGMTTNDLQKLTPGMGCYAAHLTPQGKVVAHMQILADEDALWLSLERAGISKLMEAFDKLLIMEDVQIQDASDEWDILTLIGPRSAPVLEAWLDGPLNLNAPYAHRKIEDGRVVASELGYDIWAVREHADEVLRSLTQSGAIAIDRGTWDVLRTEAGIPIHGVDIDETTTMPEIGEKGISYEKGCYVGQEVVAKVKYIGHVNRRFVGLILKTSDLPDLRSPIYKGEKEVGYVTTSLFSPGLNQPIALGFVSRSAYATDTEVEVRSEGKKLPAVIVDLPFKVK
jgi:folate-binding protein YgfZ